MTDYNRMKIKDLRQIGKEMGLLSVDKNNKKDLIERLKKGRQLSDYSKNVLLEHAQNTGILANAQMSKETILKKLTTPKLQDLGDKRLREIAKQRGVRLKGTMPRKDIIKRIEEPTAYYTVENLKRLAEDNNMRVRRGITKTELINRLTEANIISPSKSIEVSNIGVLVDDDGPLTLITSIKRETPKNAREDLDNYRKYIQNIKSEYLTSTRLKQIQKTLEEKERKANEEHSRLFTPVLSKSAFKEFARVYTIKGIEGYDGETFLNEARDSMMKILRENKGTKVKLVFTYIMEKEVFAYIANIPEVGMIFGEEEAKQFNEATICWICGGELGLDKVRDHCHYTGKYRGAAHNKCNLKYFIPVVFHNLSGYDAHLFIKNLGYNPGNINCIANNEEKYISFTKTIEVGSYVNKKGEIKPRTFNIRFIDSFKFMSTSLDSLVNNLPEEAFKNIKKYYTGDELNLIKRKGVYPYEYMDSIERFKENKLPSKKSFYSSLYDKNISDEDYAHAKKVWDTFKMEYVKDYHELYNKTDVLVLADVFENFRDICIRNYKLDPAHYFTAPGLSWDACLKMTGVRLELLTDVDMLLMFERGIRGGVSMEVNAFLKLIISIWKTSLILVSLLNIYNI